MKTKFIVLLSFLAGFIGGVSSHYFNRAPVYAQNPATPQEIRAQRFVLMDQNGVARGVFGIESNGAPEVEILDKKGHVAATTFKIWAAVHGAFRQTLSEGPKKPTLLPSKP